MADTVYVAMSVQHQRPRFEQERGLIQAQLDIRIVAGHVSRLISRVCQNVSRC